MEPFVALVRRYVVEYMNAHDPGVCPEIMEPDYVLHIGDHVMAGRDEAYVPAVKGQFAQFPDLRLTVHDLLTSGDRLALRMSEQGSSLRHGGRAASWAGIVLHRWNGSRLVETYAEEDYLSRRRQLAGGLCDAVEAAADAPWSVAAQPADPAAEAIARRWLESGAAGAGGAGITWDEGASGGPLVEAASTAVDELFSAGGRVAFHAVVRGRYAGGLPGLEGHDGRAAALGLAGILTVRDGAVAGGHIVRDRLGLQRSLTAG